MPRCPGCGLENGQSSSYCERCGSPLSAATNYTDPEAYKHTYRIPDEPPAPPTPYGYETPTPPSLYSYETPTPSAPYGDYETPTPPPPYSYEAPASGYQVQAEYSQPASFGYLPYTATSLPTRKRSGAGITLSALLFLWGISCIAFGLAGGMIHDASDTLVGSVFVIACLVGLIIMIPVLIRRKNPNLRSGRRFLLAIGITIIATIVLFIG
ncbi:MAG TPA: hypothetical protein VGU68_13220, partial [Ktedonobacteraceae bacterium]|nr:hypothetical protein [Ktedonobacteraceae bacterium]